MKISEKQLMSLIEAAKLAADDNLSDYGKKQTQKLLDEIYNQQSDILREVKE